MTSRRTFLKGLCGVAPAAALAPTAIASPPTSVTAGRDYFEELDVESFINALAPYSRLGGNQMWPEVIEAMTRIHQYTMLCAPIMGQMAAIEALKAGGDAVKQMVEEYDQRRRVIVKGLNDIGLTCFEPKGAFYAFPSVNVTGLSSEEFAERLLLEERVAVVPGSAFGQCGQGYVRCCYATSLGEIEEALRRMGRFVEKHRKV